MLVLLLVLGVDGVHGVQRVYSAVLTLWWQLCSFLVHNEPLQQRIWTVRFLEQIDRCIINS